MRRFERNRLGRDFAVGDIHGCYTGLQAALDAVAFNGRVDRLFSVGDLVDRGPESARVLEWLDRPWFNAICGNHDFLAWRSALGDPFPQVDHLKHGGEWLPELPVEEQRRIGRRLAALPLAMEVETAEGLVGIVHADCPFDDWNEMARVPWEQLSATSEIAECCLWSVSRYRRKYTGNVKNVRAVVHGHLTRAAMEMLGNVYYIDTGGWRKGGRFTLLDLATLAATRGPEHVPLKPAGVGGFASLARKAIGALNRGAKGR